MKMINRVLAFLATALLWSGAVHADLDDIRRSAEAGDNTAQLELGILFQYGFNYKDNEIPALTWYMLSANQGNAKAIKLRDALKAKMSEREVQEAMEQVASYKPSGTAVPRPVPLAPGPDASSTPATTPATTPTEGKAPTPATGSTTTAMPAEGAAPSVAPETAPEPLPVIDAQAPENNPPKEEAPGQPATR